MFWSIAQSHSPVGIINLHNLSLTEFRLRIINSELCRYLTYRKEQEVTGKAQLLHIETNAKCVYLQNVRCEEISVLLSAKTFLTRPHGFLRVIFIFSWRIGHAHLVRTWEWLFSGSSWQPTFPFGNLIYWWECRPFQNLVHEPECNRFLLGGKGAQEVPDRFTMPG